MRRFLKRNILRFLNLISPEKEKLLFILLYHSIKDEDFYLCIKKKDFIKQLEFIKENFDILSLEETKLWLCNKIELKRSSVVLTFDDGYEDNLTEVAPLLERFNIKATIFIAPYYKHQTLKTLSF
jgi:peptidoglycan/xylan/chitin deacetylase (PgdA/CDA1 family)